MVNRGGSKLRALAVALVLLTTGLTSGCGSNPERELREEAVDIHIYTRLDLQTALDQNDQELIADTHRMIGDMLDGALNRYADASPELRRLIEQMRDDQFRLAEGEVTGAEADELRQRHATYWEHLENGRLPPEFQ